MLAAAAAARDAGARSRGDADGPVFATVTERHRLAARRAGGRLGRAGPAAHPRARAAAVGGGFELAVGPAAAPERLTADAVSGHRARGQGGPAAGRGRARRGGAAGGIPYASMAVVAMAFPAQEVAAGSGLLVPPVTGRLVKGVTVSSAKWPHLSGDAAAGARLGRPLPRRGAAAARRRRPDPAVVADVADLLGLARPEPRQTALVRWGGGLPQYLVGHRERVAAVRDAVSAVPGLAVAGAAFDGVGVPACIRDAQRAVAELL